MLSFFRINDPFRLAVIVAILLIIRITLIYNGVPLIEPEVNWMTIGEKLNMGATMFSDIWDNTGPLASAVYWLIDRAVGKSVLAYHVLAIVLVIYQAILFNRILFRKNLYSEKMYVPALLYTIFMCSSVDFLTFSPMLISITFLLLMIRNIFSLNDNAFDQEIFTTGFYLGVAIMVYLPNYVFVILVALGFALFRTASVRQYLLLLYGLGFVFGGVALYYFWVGSFELLMKNYIFTAFTITLNTYIDWERILIIFGFPTLVLVIAIFRTFTERGFINFQVNCQFIMLVWVVLSIFNFLFTPRFGIYELVLLVPPLSFFGSYFFTMIKKKWVAELLFLFTVGAVIAISYYSREQLSKIQHYVISDAALSRSGEHERIKDKKILVLGNEISHYYGNTLATPYLNWQLAQAHFGKLDYYSTMIEVYNNFQKDKPEVIVDEAGFASKLFEKIPLLEKEYYRKTPKSKYYFLIRND